MARSRCTGRIGRRFIPFAAHIEMMAGVQPFISGAISKTINMPSDATVGEVESAYWNAWRWMVKAVALYRDGSKRSQPLSTGKKNDSSEATIPTADAATGLELTGEPKPYRRRLPEERRALTHKFQVAGHEGYVTVGLYPDGQPGEIFLTVSKQGSTMADRQPVEFADGSHEIPTCYYEFARRYVLPGGRLFQGFVANSADRIFESTHRR